MKQQPRNEDFVHQFWTAAFIDLLGQKEMLKKIDYVPHDGDLGNKNEFIQHIHNTYGRLKFVMDNIKKIATSLSQRQPRAEYTEEQMRIWRSMHSPDVRIQKFSDGALVYFPMSDHINLSIPDGINNILSLSGLLMFSALAAKIPIRIGIAIGAGALIDGMLYGPIVAHAYEMENTIAQFPRACVNDRIPHLLYDIARTPPSTTKGAYDQGIAERCLDYLGKDKDGNWFVDYLSPQFIANISTTEECRNLVNYGITSARDFVHDEYKHFCDEGNSVIQESCQKKLTLKERYECLKRYFDGFANKPLRRIDLSLTNNQK